MESMSKDLEKLWDRTEFQSCLADNTSRARESFLSKLYVLN